MKTNYIHIVLPKLADFMELYFRGFLDRLPIGYKDRHIYALVNQVINDNNWQDFVRFYDIQDVMDKNGKQAVPVLDLIPDDLDIEYMWIIDNPKDGHILFCIDDIRLTEACLKVIRDIFGDLLPY